MLFEDADKGVTDSELAGVESTLGFKLSPGLRQQYLSTNGGSPMPYVYEDDNLDTVVTSFLPILSGRGRRTALDSYDRLVRVGKIVPASFFPFAIDGGGDYFFVDCSSDAGMVFFYRSDTSDEGSPLLPLGVTIDEFWRRLKDE